MTSSGKTRGLAAAAVGAVTLGLLPLMSGAAYAVPAPAVLYSQFSGGVSTANDGANQSIHLLASADTTATSVQFAYSTDGGTTWINIGTPVAASNGVYSMEWTPSAGDYVNFTGHANIDIQAQGMNGGVTVGAPDAATVTLAGLVTGASVDISNAAGSSVGGYEGAYGTSVGKTFVIVSGTTSGSAVTLEGLSTAGPATAATVTGTTGIKTFVGIADFAGYDFAAVPLATAVVGANVDAGASDDAEVLSLYAQTVTTVTAVADAANVPAGGTTNVVVTIKDQNGNPIAGAHVFDKATPANEGYTGTDGTYTFAAYGAGTYDFVVDTTAAVGYDAGIDFQRTVTISSYAQAATSMTTSSSLGNVVDNDEAPVIAAKVLDQNGAEMTAPANTFSYYWSVVGNTGTAQANVPASGSNTGTSSVALALPWNATGAGKYTLHAWVEKDGTPGPSAGDIVAPTRTITVGETGVVWDSAPLAQVAAGATTALTGALEIVDGAAGSVIDGAALGDRDVSFGYTPGAGGGANSSVTETSPVKSSAAGAVTLHVADPVATPQVAETGALVDAQLSGDADQAAPALTVDFLTNLSPATVTVSAATPLIGDATPGRPVDFTITVENADNVALTNTSVDLSTDHGFFTPYAAAANGLTPDPTPTAEGDLYGNWQSLGGTITRTTDENGQIMVTLAIGRDAGFDDNGLVTATLTATAGSKSGNNNVVFSTDGVAPLNAGTLSVAFADAATQDSTVLPDARVDNQDVCFDIKATDQFGNRVKTTAVTAASSDVTHAPITAGGTFSNFEGACGATVNADQAGTSSITATWGTPPSDVYTDSDLVTAGFQYAAASHGAAVPAPADITADSPVVTWYDIDLAASSFVLSHSTADAVQVGTLVDETVTATDQLGQPIDGLLVQFYRSGPDVFSDGTPDKTGNTGDNGSGKVTYTYQGAKPGTADVTARVSSGGTTIADLSDSVQFKVNVKATLSGKSITRNGKHFDVLTVTTSKKAAGAVVVFKDGAGHVLGKAKVNSSGIAKLRVLDRKPTKARVYKAHVKASQLTFAANTNRIRIK